MSTSFPAYRSEFTWERRPAFPVPTDYRFSTTCRNSSPQPWRRNSARAFALRPVRVSNGFLELNEDVLR
jgi:hypothetical protein